jgi:hypothetical protein
VTAPLLVLRQGRGRQPEEIERLRDLDAELTAHNAEALALVRAAGPHLSALVRMAQELGPIALKHALSLNGLLQSYERRHQDDEPEPLELAA